MNRLIAINRRRDIPKEYRNTPVGLLLEYHNLGRPFDEWAGAPLLIGMCMDNRKRLRIPDNFAFVLRSGGANLQFSGFKVAYAISVGGVRAIALIGHTHCGMVNLQERRDLFVRGMVEGAGWKLKRAREYFKRQIPTHEIGNEIDFILSEVQRLRKQYPRILVMPLLYQVEDRHLYVIRETNQKAPKRRSTKR